MKISIKIKKEIEKEIKCLKDLLKTLEHHEQQYQVDLTTEKENIHKSIDYYYLILKEQ